MYLWHVPAFRWFFKVLYGFFFLNQSSLRLAFPLGVLHLFLGNFTLWPGRIPLSPMYISKQALNRFTPVEFFQSQPKGRVSGVCVSPRMKMIISVLITHWPGSSLDFFLGCKWSKKTSSLIWSFCFLPLSGSILWAVSRKKYQGPFTCHLT